MRLPGVTFTGEAFSEYFCTELLQDDPLLRGTLDPNGADSLYKAVGSEIRQADRELRGRIEARSTDTLLLQKLAKVLGWKLGEPTNIVTDIGEEEDAGRALLASANYQPSARIVCIGPQDHLDSPPEGFHRRFAPSHSLPRILKEQNLSYGILLNAYRLRLVTRVGALPSSIEFDLGLIAEGQDAGKKVWRLLYGLLRGDAWSSEPALIERVRVEGKQHQERVSSDLGEQVQRAVIRFMQGVLDHPANKGKLPEPLTPEALQTLYQETLRLLYRLLFVLYAEDLHLLPMEVTTYREGYSLARLVRLARATGVQSLEEADPNGVFFEASLKALFTLLRTGVALGPEGEIRPYAGGLFDQTATSLIDGLNWGNATVDKVLEFLRFVPAPKGGGLIPLSYRELNVEQLGSIYEGLLEMKAAHAKVHLWCVEVDGRFLEINDAERERIRAVRGERSDIEEDISTEEADPTDAESIEEAEMPKPSRTVKKPMRIMHEVKPGRIFLKGGFGRKQTGSYYTNRAFVEFLVREALDPLARGKSSKEILSLKIVDPAMGSAHFLVGACRRLGEHLLDAYRREVSKVRAQHGRDLSEPDALVLADVPDQLQRIWDIGDNERESAICRQLVAGNCIYGVDKNPLAVDLAKVSLWLATAAAREPLTFLDHRLRHGDALLGLPAEEVVRPWTMPDSGSAGRRKPALRPADLLVSPKHGQDKFDFYAPNRQALCQAFGRAFVLLAEMLKSVSQDPANFAFHGIRYQALQASLRPWQQLHALRVGAAFQDTAVSPELINGWLDDLLQRHRVSDANAAAGAALVSEGVALDAFCWQMTFPEVFYTSNGEHRPDAGFDCVLGNPPWDKIKAERDEFYLEYDPLIRQLQGSAKDRRIDALHREDPAVKAAWERREQQKKRLAEVLLTTGLYGHQTAEIEEEDDQPDGTVTTVRKSTGGDADLFKIFIERAWQLLRPGGVFGMVTSKSFHNGDSCTGLRRLVLDQCTVRVLCNFDNERKIFPGIHNAQDFDLLVFTKGGLTDSFDSAFLTRETENAVQNFRSHPGYIRLRRDDVARLSPQRLTIFEFRSQFDLDLASQLFRENPTFRDGLRRQLRLTFRRELDMDKHSFLFRPRAWLRDRGCREEPGQQWRAETAEYYRIRRYLERPIAEWYVLFEAKIARKYLLPWTVKSAAKINEDDLGDFTIRIDLPGGWRFFGKLPADSDHPAVFIHPDDASPGDLPAHVPGQKAIGHFAIAPSLRPAEIFQPLMEGKWIYHLDHRAMAYVTGSGSWIVTRPLAKDEKEVVPQYFVQRFDAATRVGVPEAPFKLAFRDVTAASNERSFVAALVPSELPCAHQLPVFVGSADPAAMRRLAAWGSSFVTDFVMRLISGGHATLGVVSQLPAPSSLPAVLSELCNTIDSEVNAQKLGHSRALIDAVMAVAFRVSLPQYCRILASFPLLDRDQPALPGDYRIRATNRGIEHVSMSFITRDLALLTYLDYLSGHLDVKPDATDIARVSPSGAPKPPYDVVSIFATAGVDIDAKSEQACSATGVLRDLRERVVQAEKLGAVAYVATIDRRRARFVESAAAAGGLPISEGVLTSKMAERVLRDKNARVARKAKAEQLWEEMLGTRTLHQGDAKTDPVRKSATRKRNPR